MAMNLSKVTSEIASWLAVPPRACSKLRSHLARNERQNPIEVTTGLGVIGASENALVSAINRLPSDQWSIRSNRSIVVGVSGTPHLPRVPTHDIDSSFPSHRLLANPGSGCPTLLFNGGDIWPCFRSLNSSRFGLSGDGSLGLLPRQ